MSNKLTHLMIGALCGGGAYFAYTLHKNEDVTVGGFLLSLTWGGIFGLLPDFFEPAVNPHHRASLHSLIVLLGLIFGGEKILNNSILTTTQKLTLLVPSAAYTSHLILDAGTAKGLPFL